MSKQVEHFSRDLRLGLRAGPLSPSGQRALEALISSLAELLSEQPVGDVPEPFSRALVK